MANHHILNRAVESVSHVQHSRHIRRRDHDREGLGIGIAVHWRCESAGGLPTVVEILLDLAGLKACG